MAFTLVTDGDEPILGVIQLASPRLRCGIISVRDASGGGARQLLHFRNPTLALARVLNATELELFGGAVINRQLEALLRRQGFVLAVDTIPDELGGGTMEILTRVFPVG